MFLASLKLNFRNVSRYRIPLNQASAFKGGDALNPSPHKSLRSNMRGFISNSFLPKFYSLLSRSESALTETDYTNSQSTSLDRSNSMSNISMTLQKRHCIVIGDTGSGKSSFINKITNKEECETSSQPTSVTQMCQWVQTNLPNFGDCVFIDTPGFGDTRPDFNDKDILNVIMSEVLDMHEDAQLAFVLCHSVRNTRSHAESIFENIASTMGPEILKSTMVVLTSTNLMQFDALSKEIHQNFVKFLSEKFTMSRKSIIDFDSVDPQPNQVENIVEVLDNLPPYDWRQIKSLRAENEYLFKQLQEKEKIDVEVIIPTPVQIDDAGIYSRFYEESFLHQENRSTWVGWNYILLGIPYLFTLKDIKMFTCRLPMTENAYDLRIKDVATTAIEGDYEKISSTIVEKPDRLEVQSTLEFYFARSDPAKVKWKLMVEYEYSELRKKTIMVDKKERKLVSRPDDEIWERVRALQRSNFREKIRKIRLT